MSSGPAATLPMTTLDDDAWEDLLSFIEDRRVIPIVGPELLLVSTERWPRRLAAITDCDLCVSTTCESLLESAINLERFAGASSTDVLSYSPNRVVDLPTERERLQRPLVYHLFGKLSASPTYVISDEDLLE